MSLSYPVTRRALRAAVRAHVRTGCLREIDVCFTHGLRAGRTPLIVPMVPIPKHSHAPRPDAGAMAQFYPRWVDKAAPGSA